MTKKRSDRATTDPHSPELAKILRNFVACDRCSFFLAGYRVIHGLDDLEAAASTQSDQWLSLSWDRETRHLLQKSYGGRLDVDLYYYDSHCPACQRRFIYQAGDEESDEPGSLRIEIKK